MAAASPSTGQAGGELIIYKYIYIYKLGFGAVPPSTGQAGQPGEEESSQRRRCPARVQTVKFMSRAVETVTHCCVTITLKWGMALKCTIISFSETEGEH